MPSPFDASAELANFQEIAKELLPQPGEIPRLQGIDVWGGTVPLNQALGGDHVIYVDFKQRYDLDARIAQASYEERWSVVEHLRRCHEVAGIAVLDVSGHQATDALVVAMLHQAFLLGALYELDMFGRITKQLFENLNTRFYNSSSPHKFVSLLYGEVSEASTFRFISAAQPLPLVFSNRHDRFMDISPELSVSFPPIGVLPSLGVIDHHVSQAVLGFKERYVVNEWVLMGSGDILLLHTDGLSEHINGSVSYFPHRLEQTVREVKTGTARDVYDAIQADVAAFGKPADDITVVVVKRT